jgi:hypothetical protein
MNSAIAAKNHNRIGLLNQRGPLRVGGALKCRQRFAYIPRPENDGGIHSPAFEHRNIAVTRGL